MTQILDTRLMHPKDQIILIISRIYKRGLTTTSGGNISVIDDDGNIWITPSAVDKGSLRPSDIMCITREGKVVGRHKPSSEYPFHRAIYASRPDLKPLYMPILPHWLPLVLCIRFPTQTSFPRQNTSVGLLGLCRMHFPEVKSWG